LSSRLAAYPDPLEIATFLCSDQSSGQMRGDLHVILVNHALALLPATEVLGWTSQLQVGCRQMLEWNVLETALALREAQDAAWFAEFRRTLTPELLFDPEAGEAGILVSFLFLRKGDAELRSWIEAGARGELGGTAEQIDRAIGVSRMAQAPGSEMLAHLQAVITSAQVPGGGAIGSTFVHALLDQSAWPDGGSRPALETLLSVLYDERFQESAAAMICMTLPVEPPEGCDPDRWAAVRARALEIADQIGLVLPDAKR